MTETNINLLFAKINIKREKDYYAPMDVINPRLLNSIPRDAKTYKLTPTTTLFFRMPRCSSLNFGWREIKIKSKKPKEKNMYKKNVSFSSRECAAVARTFRKNFYAIKKEKRQAILHENRGERKAMSFWQKTAVFLVEANHDMSLFFENDRRHGWSGYSCRGTPGDKLTAFFLKKKCKNKENKTTEFMDMEDEMEKMELEEEKSIRQGIQHVFKPRQARIPEPMREQIIEIEEMPLPDAPVQPPRNPEHQDGTTINNISINFTCTIS